MGFIWLQRVPIYWFHANRFFWFCPKHSRTRNFSKWGCTSSPLPTPSSMSLHVFGQHKQCKLHCKKWRTQVFQKDRLLQLATSIYSGSQLAFMKHRKKLRLWLLGKAISADETNLTEDAIIPETRVCLNTLSSHN